MVEISDRSFPGGEGKYSMFTLTETVDGSGSHLFPWSFLDAWKQY